MSKSFIILSLNRIHLSSRVQISIFQWVQLLMNLYYCQFTNLCLKNQHLNQPRPNLIKLSGAQPSQFKGVWSLKGRIKFLKDWAHVYLISSVRWSDKNFNPENFRPQSLIPLEVLYISFRRHILIRPCITRFFR